MAVSVSVGVGVALGRGRGRSALWRSLGRSPALWGCSGSLRRSETLWAGQGIREGSEGTEGTEQSAGDQSRVKGIRGEQRGGKQHPHHTHPNRTGVRPPTPRPTPKAKGQKAPQTFPAKPHPPARVVVHFFGLLVGLCYVGGWVLSMFWIAVWVMAGCVFWVLVCSVL